MKILIIDTGGNIFSLKKIIEYCGYEADILTSDKNINNYDILFLPGIGSFDNPIKKLKDLSLLDLFSNTNFFSNKALIGICVGMQILFENSEEGSNNGLSLIKGSVKKFSDEKLKVPHMGWNYINTLNYYENLNEKRFYFAHSYYVECEEKYVLAYCNYGKKFPAIVRKNNIFGIQFHPEKSHKNGIDLLQSILSEFK